MKRDMDLIRALLLHVEAEQESDMKRWSEDQQKYHLALLVEAKLVHGDVILDADGDIATVIYTRLTWEGHEFLDAARDDNLWQKTKEKLSAAGINVALPVLTSLLTDFAKKKLGI